MTAIKVLTSIIRGKRREGFDIAGAVRHAFANLIERVAGILGKLVLPAMIVTNKTFKEAVEDLQRAVKTWPEIISFELGIGPLTGIVSFALFCIIGLVSVFVGSLNLISGIIFFVLALFLLIVAMTILSTTINMTFYTLLYLALVEKKKFKNAKELFTKF